MSKLARACAVAVAVATSLAGGIAAAQIQGGVARKAAPPAVALGVPVAKANVGQRSSASVGSGSPLSFASGQPALRYQAVDLPSTKDPVRREAIKDSAKEPNVSARGAAAAGTANATGEFAPAPGVLRANMPPVTFADAQGVLKARVLPTNVNQGVTAAPKTAKTSTLARMKIAGDAAASGPASLAELARSLRHHPDLNRPSVIQENGSVNLASYAYDDLDRRTTVTLGNGTTIQRSYDNQGALATLKNFLASPSQEVQYAYTRNQLREVKSVSWTNNLYQWGGATPGTKSYTSNGLNQYTAAGGAAQSYDANGNLTGDGTWSYGYDLDNRLKTASKTGTAASLAYDAEGRLRQTVIGASTTNLLYDATNLIAEYDAAGTTLQRRYVHGPGTDEPIVWYEGSGTTAKNWFYADHLGSIVATANATGASTGIYSYGPYGEPNTTTGPRFRYTGQQLIGELGLYHYKARFYSPGLGRFLQTDPIGYKDDVNLYAYVGNDPGNRIDPTGLASLGAWAYPGASGASTFPVAPQSSVQGTPLGNWIDNSPIHDPPLEGVYPEQFLIGGGLGVLRGAAQALAKGVGSAAAKETTRVGRWMSHAEYDAMRASGKVQESLSGTTHVASPADASAFISQARPGSAYVEFNVPSSSLKATNEGWSKVVGPNSLEGRLAGRKGLPIPQMPAATDIVHSATRLP